MNNFVPDFTTLLNEAVSRHPAAIVVGDFVPSAFDPIIKKATAEGIAVVIFDSGAPSWQADGAITYIGYSYPYNGTISGQQALKAGVRHLLCVDEAPVNPDILATCQAAKTVLQKSGGTSAQLDIPIADQSNPAAITQDIQGYLASHPSINGVYDPTSGSGPTEIQAVKNLGKIGKIRLGSNDITPSTLQEIKTGQLSWDIDKDPYLEGFYSVQTAAQYLKYHLTPTSPILTGGILVTTQNVNNFLSVSQQYPGVLGPS
jgi:simple sugar transport system substrate-binding protein